MNSNKPRFSRRMVALFWMIVVGAVFGGLIYNEQISILYVLVTLSLVVLLLVVGFADLEKVSLNSSSSDDNRV